MRTARHDSSVLRPDLAGADAHEFTIVSDGTATVLDEDGLRVTAFPVGVVGGVASVGYRFDYRGRAIVIGGHEKPTQTLARACARRHTGSCVHSGFSALAPMRRRCAPLRRD